MARPVLRDTAEEARAQLGMAALAVLNPLFFALRGRVRFRRAGYAESPEACGAIPEELMRAAASDRARRLERAYRTTPALQARLSHASWLLTLYTMDLLDAALEHADFAPTALARLEGGSYAPIDALDIGARNFISAIALWHILEPPPSHASPAPRGARLTGVEIDGWRILRGWHSRHDLAQYYLSLLPTASSARGHAFLTMDFMRLDGQFDFISWFRPFMDAYPLLHWGLPRRLLRPEPMFAHMLERLRPGGVAVIVNQEPHENEAQHRLINAARSELVQHVAFEYRSCFTLRLEPAFIHVIRKALPAKAPAERGETANDAAGRN